MLKDGRSQSPYTLRIFYQCENGSSYLVRGIEYGEALAKPNEATPYVETTVERPNSPREEAKKIDMKVLAFHVGYIAQTHHKNRVTQSCLPPWLASCWIGCCSRAPNQDELKDTTNALLVREGMALYQRHLHEQAFAEKDHIYVQFRTDSLTQTPWARNVMLYRANEPRALPPSFLCVEITCAKKKLHTALDQWNQTVINNHSSDRMIPLSDFNLLPRCAWESTVNSEPFVRRATETVTNRTQALSRPPTLSPPML